jgi:hypothetical protein
MYMLMSWMAFMNPIIIFFKLCNYLYENDLYDK